MGRRIGWLVVLVLSGFVAASAVPPAGAQTPALDAFTGQVAGAAVEVPDDLSPGAVDSFLATVSDADARRLLRDELHRQGAARAAEEAGDVTGFAAARTRLAAMAETIAERVTRWADRIRNIRERGDRIASRLALATHGLPGMLLAAAGLVAAGAGAASAVTVLVARWRRRLAFPERAGYWDRVFRSIAVGALDIAPVVGFVLVTTAAAPPLAGPLGPLTDYVWIYHAGVSNGWALIVVLRRAFAPDASAIRITAMSDEAALTVHRVVRQAVIVGVAGWLLAGFFPVLGFGFPPAMISVALAGTVVAGLLLAALWRNRDLLREAMERVLAGPDGTCPEGSARAGLVLAAPILAGAYLGWSYLYWVSLWLEQGRQHLDGPVGTLLVVFALPVVDRLGQEIAVNLCGRSDTANRFRAVLVEAWRLLVGVVAAVLIADLWGLDLIAIAKGADAMPVASAVFDIAVTLLIAQVAWRFIVVGLHRQVEAGAEDEEEAPGNGEDGAAPSSRLDTLVPLFRTILLAILVVVVAMIVLSSIGIDVGPLLASAGIVGIAIGFGAQTLVRDVFSGAFFLIDDAFRVGEYVELDETLRGEVEAISIRSLRLRHHRGAIVTIPFGELKNVTNHSRDWVIYKMNFRLEPETDPNRVKKLVKQVGADLLAHPDHGPKFLEPLKSQGVFMIDDDSALVIRVKFKSKPRQQFVLRREVYHRLREVFAANGIHLARRKVEVVGPEGAAGGAAALAAEAAAPAARPER